MTRSSIRARLGAFAGLVLFTSVAVISALNGFWAGAILFGVFALGALAMTIFAPQTPAETRPTGRDGAEAAVDTAGHAGLLSGVGGAISRLMGS